MRSSFHTRRCFLLALSFATLVCIGLVCVRRSDPQQPKASDSSIQTTTQERLESETWWPTKSSAPLSAYTGSETCTKCHAEETASSPTAMQRASAPAAGSRFLASALHKSLNAAPYTYTFAGPEFSVARGTEALAQKIGWDMGAGDLAHTFLYEHNSQWFQSQVTFYTQPAVLDTTTGLNAADDANLHGALGQKLTGEEARKCFGCHTVHATTSAGFNPAHAEPGLGCEGCHGPGRQHAEAEAAQPRGIQPKSAQAKFLTSSPFRTAIFNPAVLSPVDSIDYCGSCHRTSMDATLAAGPNSLGTATVRFQPYRLQQSKCWRATQSDRLTCTACHDPHQSLERSAAKYDKTCLGCHTVIKGSSAPHHISEVSSAGTTSCVSCHMPKVQVASMHGAFTDHRIRISRAGEGYPD